MSNGKRLDSYDDVAGEITHIKPPSFATYDELKEILVSSLELFDSFKKEVLETLDKSE